MIISFSCPEAFQGSPLPLMKYKLLNLPTAFEACFTVAEFCVYRLKSPNSPYFPKTWPLPITLVVFILISLLQKLSSNSTFWHPKIVFRPLLLEKRCLNQQRDLRTCQKCNISNPAPDLLNQNFILTKSTVKFEIYWLRLFHRRPPVKSLKSFNIPIIRNVFPLLNLLHSGTALWVFHSALNHG